MTIKEAIDGARKIVLKIGSNTLVHSDGSINTEFLTRFADDCAGLIKKGKQLIIVSSGAQVTGLATINGAVYYFDDAGAMQTGIVEIGGVPYLFDVDGKMITDPAVLLQLQMADAN